MNKKEYADTMSKNQYITEIVQLLQDCDKESVFLYIKSFLEKIA